MFSSYFVTVPAAANTDFRRMETDSPELHKLTINGTAVATVYSSNSDFYTPPGVNEVFIMSNGKIYFNAADLGKTITGTYAHLLF